MDSIYQKGSEWRKWDLHVHTPYSILNNQFSGDWDEYVRTLFNKAIASEIACIGITDYFSIDGYKKLKQEYLENEGKLLSLFSGELEKDDQYIEKIKKITVFPNIELRLANVISSNKNGNVKNAKLEYHLILSDKLSIAQIEENILHQIYFSAECSIQLGTDNRSITKNNLEALGAKLKNSQAEFQNKSDYYIGCMCASIDFSELIKVRKNNSNELLNNMLFVLVEDDITKYAWNDSAHMVRKNIYANSHLIFSSNRKTSAWGLTDSTKGEFSSYKGCIWGSDAHSYDRLFSPDDDHFCWVKADPTFQGLIQATIHPHGRFYIGALPTSLDTFIRNKSRYISNVVIGSNEHTKNSETWFNANIPINSGLVAIIGNKGSGKSALSDIIGYLCHCSSMNQASFLSKERFQREDKKFAADYHGEVTWADNHKLFEESLYSVKDGSVLEYAKYLPQKYIESVCSNLGNEFQDEVNSVIFSYIDSSEKLGALTLSELIEKKSESLYSSIRAEQQKLEPINKKIISIEDKKAPSFLEDCVKKKKALDEELERVLKDKPEAVAEPSKSEDAESARRIIEIESSITDYENKISLAKSSLSDINANLTEIDSITNDGMTLKASAGTINERYNAFLKRISHESTSAYIELIISENTLQAIKNELNTKKESIILTLKEIPESENDVNSEYIEKIRNDYEGSLYFSILELNNEKSNLVVSVSSEQKRYQKYKEDIKSWNDKQIKIKGDKNTENTIEYYAELIRYVTVDIDSDLESLEAERAECIKNIYEYYKQISSVFSDLYKPIESKLSNILNNVDDTINFSADIVARRDLNSELFGKINKQVKGPLRGTQNALTFFDELIRGTNFNEYSGISSFFNKIVSTVREDPEQTSKVVPDRLDFYNFLSELRYISVEYTLKLGGKKIAALSAGERGMLLLVFYLALSKDNTPLIIDQPEDNLDNQSVYNRLVPCIIEAKKNRQVIIVTHNPNIAVACDAEQIIYCEIDKSKTEISYQSGSIENFLIRKRVIDVLEGTEPAFDLRKSKYFFDLTQHKFEEIEG